MWQIFLTYVQWNGMPLMSRQPVGFSTMADEEKLRQYLKKVTAELQRSRRQLSSLERREREPVVIIGMSCRFPGGVKSPEELWQLVDKGKDAVSSFPENRGWDPNSIFASDYNHLGGSATGGGGFLHDADRFDAAFFGIDQREALAMDPQQRLLLETSWEALERAGINPTAVRGAPVGVYVGAAYGQYAALLNAMLSEDSDVKDYLTTGGAASTASGRVAYALGLVGPAVTIDTACSSSLVALHMAGQALHHGDCTLALVGGVTIMATPDIFSEWGRQGLLAPDGRSKPFAAAADGIGFAEGVGMLLVERLSAARRNRHPILAIVRGSAINQGGATNGLTAPSGPAEERLIRQALSDARLTPDQVDVVEADGIGTSIGDPIEVQALLATYGQTRADGRPLWLGSIRSNIGHTQYASGVAGVIKMVMAMRHGRLPRTLHIDRPTPLVDWSAGSVVLLTEPISWPENARPRRAGVSAFGFSGTNAHVILEQPRSGPDTPSASGSAASAAAVHDVLPWVVSAATSSALQAQVHQLRQFIEAHPELAPMDVGYSLAATRSTFRHRAVIVARQRNEFLRGLSALCDDVPADLVVRGEPDSPGKIAFLFFSQSGWPPDAARHLAEAFPAFALALDAICNHLDAVFDRPIRDQIFATEQSLEDSRLHRLSYVHAVQFAFEIALYRLVESFGLRPDHLAGDREGEICAAHAAGVLSLPDACALVVARGHLMEAPPGTEAGTASQNVRHVAESLNFRPPEIPIVSNVTGRHATTEQLCSPDYWVGHTRQAGRFLDGVQHLRAGGVTFFLGLGLDSTVTDIVDGRLAGTGQSHHRAVLVPVLRHDRPAPSAFLASVAEAHTHGARADWTAAFTGTAARTVELPTYPFQRQRYWPDQPSTLRDLTSIESQQFAHPLLGAAVELAGTSGQWFRHTLTAKRPWFVAQHRLFGAPVLPAAAMIEWALAGIQAGARGETPAWSLRDITFTEILSVPARESVAVQAVVETVDGTQRVHCYARPDRRSGSHSSVEPSAPWIQHIAVAAVVPTAPAQPGLIESADLLKEMNEQDTEALYSHLWRVGLEYGPGWRGLRRLWRHGNEAIAEVQVGMVDADDETYFLHPAVLDGCFHSAAAFAEGDLTLRIPSAVSQISVYGRLPACVWCHARWHGGEASGDHSMDLRLLSKDKDCLVKIDKLQLRPISATALGALAGQWLHRRELTNLVVRKPQIAQEALLTELCDRMAQLLNLTAAERDKLRAAFRDMRLNKVGLDSLMTIRLRNQLLLDFGVTIPLTVLLGDSTAISVVELIANQLAARSLVAMNEGNMAQDPRIEVLSL